MRVDSSDGRLLARDVLDRDSFVLFEFEILMLQPQRLIFTSSSAPDRLAQIRVISRQFRSLSKPPFANPSSIRRQSSSFQQSSLPLHSIVAMEVLLNHPGTALERFLILRSARMKIWLLSIMLSCSRWLNTEAQSGGAHLPDSCSLQ